MPWRNGRMANFGRVLFLVAAAAFLCLRDGHASRQCLPDTSTPTALVSAKPLADPGSEEILAHLRMAGARFEISHRGAQRVIRYTAQLWVGGKVFEPFPREGIFLCPGDEARVSVSAVEDGAGAYRVTFIAHHPDGLKSSSDFKLTGPAFRGVSILPLELPAKLSLADDQDSIVWGIRTHTSGPGGDPSPAT